jgi:outer membrane lipoprotein LolB
MKQLLIPLLCLFLWACSTTPVRPPVADPQQAWQQHHSVLAALQQWQLFGRLAIQTGDEGWHASLNWLQQQQHYSIQLIAPLGQGTIQLQGDDQQVILDTGEDNPILASDPEALLFREFGWRVPVASLRYWVLGLPAPGKSRHELDSYGRLARLFQNGWEIHFFDYDATDELELPGKIFINNHRAKVRLVVNRWELAPASEEAG